MRSELHQIPDSAFPLKRFPQESAKKIHEETNMGDLQNNHFCSLAATSFYTPCLSYARPATTHKENNRLPRHRFSANFGKYF